ncbi:YdcF family protein [uncultured Megasphaera sp.]|uniref:YdcF family protein n=1 Tax=uncultured Megasphaera sp. TaxID=165188 RepID=UPI0025E3E0F2|nr:YdcF family protein [uncultured Megasphaera sp.]
MLLYIIKWLYAWILPMGGIVLALLILIFYMFRRKSQGRWVLAVITAVFYLLSIEPVSNALIHPLETAYDQPRGADAQGDVIVLLGGGSRAGVPDFDGTGQVGSAAANRFLMALRLQKAKDLPILLSGGTILKGDANESAIEKRMLLSLGVPEDKIFMDDKSRNTAENAAFSKNICAEQGWSHPILVTSAFHMPRSVRFFQREGLDVTPYPCDYHTSAVTNWSGYSVVPQSFYLFNSCLAIKEYVGIAAASLRMQ